MFKSILYNYNNNNYYKFIKPITNLIKTQSLLSSPSLLYNNSFKRYSTFNNQFLNRNILNSNTTSNATSNNDNQKNVLIKSSNSKLTLPIFNKSLIKTTMITTTTITTNKPIIPSPPVNDWIAKLPNSIQPYLRLSRVDKPIGVWLLLYPCCWSISLAAPAGSLPDLKTMFVFGVGAFVMRSAGCVINDMADYKFDSKVERTKTRPIASKQLTHKQGLIFLGAQLLTSFGLILSNLNYYTIALCASSLPIVILYPFMKRFTYYPQFVLGLAFNWGALAGYSAIVGHCDWSVVLPLYLAGISWTMVYDTIYAHQDKKDDLLIGVKSTALKFAGKSRIILSAFSTLVISGMFLTGIAANMPFIYYLGTAACSGHLIWQLKTVDFNNPSSCLDKFISNKDFGLYYLIIIIISKLLQDDDNENSGGDKDKLQQQQQQSNTLTNGEYIDIHHDECKNKIVLK